MSEQLQQLTDAATEKGRIVEQNRVLAILVQYKKAGWIDPALAILLADDIGTSA
jgi:hypothetical protein